MTDATGRDPELVNRSPVYWRCETPDPFLAGDDLVAVHVIRTSLTDLDPPARRRVLDFVVSYIEELGQ